MIPALKYPRFPVYRTSRLEGTTFIETAACYVPDFSYQYHAFLIIDGREVKKSTVNRWLGRSACVEKCCKTLVWRGMAYE